MKKCTKCGVNKPMKDFSRSKQMSCGRSSWCKKCQVIINRKYIKKYSKRNYTKTKNKLKEIKDTYGLGAGTIARYGFKLALEVYETAERKCDICGEENDLTIHHKDRNGRNNERKGLLANNNINNLQLLCRKCHGSIHGKQGGRPKN